MFKLNHLAAIIALSSSFSLYAAEAYDRSKSYSSGSQVTYNGNLYEAQWWANPNDTPAAVTENSWESPWILISEGGGINGGSSGDGNGSNDSNQGETTPPATPDPEPEVDNGSGTPEVEGDHPFYSTSAKYNAGDVVQNGGKLYQCKDGVTVPWCSGASWAYEPGKGTAWKDAWQEISANDVVTPPINPDQDKPSTGGGTSGEAGGSSGGGSGNNGSNDNSNNTGGDSNIGDSSNNAGDNNGNNGDENTGGESNSGGDVTPTPPPEPPPLPDPEPEVEEPTPLPDGGYQILQSELDKQEAAAMNTPLMNLVSESIKTLDNKTVEAIRPKAETNPENVKRIEGIVSEEDWDYIFPKRTKEYTYRNFLQATGKFPGFCKTFTDGRDSDAICRLALATMFAHFTQETGGHTPSWDVPEWRQGLVHVREMGWSEEARGGYNGDCAHTQAWQQQKYECGKFENGDFKSYFGRGAKQLSYNYNYGPFSEAMFGTPRVLLDNPDMVADTWLNLASAVFFFMYPQPPKPSMMHVIDGTWKPNAHDLSTNLTPGFGVTTMIINGGVECNKDTEIIQSLNRQEYFKNFANYLEVEIDPNQSLGCAHMKEFAPEGAGALNIYWEQDWGWSADTPGNASFKCQLKAYQTAHSAFTKGDYRKCVEYHFPAAVVVDDVSETE